MLDSGFRMQDARFITPDPIIENQGLRDTCSQNGIAEILSLEMPFAA